MQKQSTETTFDQDLKSIVSQLSPPVQDFLASGKIEIVANNLIQKYQLHIDQGIDQGVIVEREIITRLLGLKNPVEFSQALIEKARLDRKVVNEITQYVNENIFTPLRKEEEQSFRDARGKNMDQDNSSATMSTERTYFQQGNVTVTSARFIVGAQTFTMRNITSIKTVEVEPTNSFPGYLMIIGCAIALIGFSNSSISAGVFGLVIAAAGGYWAWHQSSTFSVVLTTAAGEVSACTSQNGKLIATIVDALNRSIVERG